MKIGFGKYKPSQKAIAVVTGAGSGIGRAFAIEIAQRGGVVLCSDINLESAQATAGTIKAQGAHAVAYACDVSQATQVEKMAAEASALLVHPTLNPEAQAVSLLINNAGVGIGGRVDELTLEDWAWCLNINLWGVIHGCHYFAPMLKNQRQGGIVNVASAAGFGALPEMAAYNVSKAGVMSLSETLHAELKKFGISVNVLCPTIVPTNIMHNGRIPPHMSGLAHKAMSQLAWTTAEKVVNKTLDALDKWQLYTVPQPDARLVWAIKRWAPSTYAAGLGEAYRFVR
jgi:NAD(P)-dependent dehydrogenase (short-subunit alcohol dehydrogenase family)